MHDIDTTRLEFEPESSWEAYDQETAEELEADQETALDEAEVEELAAELLGVTNEAELDQFLGKLFRKVRKNFGGVGDFLKKAGGPLAGALKGIAQKALPVIGGALGTAIPIPGVGTALGSAAGKLAGNLLGSELESLTHEDREFEVAKRFVRLAGTTAVKGARRPNVRNPQAAVIAALRRALARLRRRRRFVRRPMRQAPPDGGPYAGYPATDTTAPAGGMAAGGYDDGSGGDIEEPLDEPAPLGEPAADTAKAAGGTDGGAGEWEFESDAYETMPPPSNQRSGRWVKRGTKIVLYGV